MTTNVRLFLILAREMTDQTGSCVFPFVGVLSDSSVLLPGDLVDLSESSLHTFPADFVLLSGDAIVNESMLTGESVPVSKVPIEAEGVALISIPGGEIRPELSRHILFSGTKIVRIRKTSPPVSVASSGAPEALAMVMRTGGLFSCL